jgi:hypothetical protein
VLVRARLPLLAPIDPTVFVRSIIDNFETEELASRAEMMKLRDTQLANRIQLHLALGGQP